MEFIFTESEIKKLQKNPDALQVLITELDVESGIAYDAGYAITYYDNRIKRLKDTIKEIEDNY